MILILNVWQNLVFTMQSDENNDYFSYKSSPSRSHNNINGPGSIKSKKYSNDVYVASSPLLGTPNTRSSTSTCSNASSPGYSVSRNDFNTEPPSNNGKTGNNNISLTNAQVMNDATTNTTNPTGYLKTGSKLQQQNSHPYHSPISNSSTNSSRRPSTGNIITTLPSLSHLPSQHYLPTVKKVRSKSSSKEDVKRPLLENMDSKMSTPTLLISPDMVKPSSFTKKKTLESSLSTPSHASISLTPGPSTPGNINYSNTHMGSPAIKPSMMQNDSLTSIMSNNTRSGTYPSTLSSSSLRAFKKQYILNEQLYLDKLKNTMPDDDYYTRRIVPTAPLDDYDDENIQRSFDAVDIHSESKGDDTHIKRNVSYNDTVDNQSNNSDNNVNSFLEFGINADTTNNVDGGNIFSMNGNFLRKQLEWLREKQSDALSSDIPEKDEVEISKTISRQILHKFFSEMDCDGVMNLDLLSEVPTISDRLIWQTILSNVLHGDIVKNEKTKIAKQVKNPTFTKQYSEDIWLDLKCWMTGKSKDNLIKTLATLRKSSDSVFNEILNFTIPEDILDEPKKIEVYLTNLMDEYYKTVNFWPNMKSLCKDKPIVRSPMFIKRIDTINGWLNIRSNFESKIDLLKKWIGNENKYVSKVIPTASTEKSNSKNPHNTLAEQLIKERDIEQMFQQKIFFPMAPWILKTKLLYLNSSDIMEDLKLGFPNDQIALIMLFPMELIERIIVIRLNYAQKLKNPTMMMVDEMIDDFTSYIRLATQLKCSFMEFCRDWPFEINLDDSFDTTVLDAIAYLFSLLHLKILETTKTSFTMFEESDLLLKFWEELKNVGQYIDDAGILVCNEFSRLVLRILHRLHTFLLQQQNSPPSFKTSHEAEKWLIDIFENLGSMKRKINRFTNVLMKAFQNCVKYKIEDHSHLIEHLENTGHFLLYSGGEIEENGVYIIGSPELLGCTDTDLIDILNYKDIGSDLIPELEIKNSLSIYNATNSSIDPNTLITEGMNPDGNYYFYMKDNHMIKPKLRKKSHTNLSSTPKAPAFESYVDSQQEILRLEAKLQSLGYLLIICPKKPMFWGGDIYDITDYKLITMEKLLPNIQPGTLTLMNQGSSYALEYQSDKFDSLPSVSFVEKCCSYQAIENNLQRINKSYFRLTYTLLNDYDKLLNHFQNTCPQNDLMNSIFLFVRDFATNFLRNNVANYEKKSAIIFLMIDFSINWLSFLVEDCDPTDLRTFRWCVPAMEFAMKVVNGWNILSLNHEEFTKLKNKMSLCMTLLISHFDVMGARSTDVETNIQQLRLNNMENESKVEDDDEVLSINSQIRLKSIRMMEQTYEKTSIRVGKVLDATEKANKYILSLASSLSNVQIRWKKRKFVGGGSFGSVFSAINLDTGEILAVKEIKIQDTKVMEKIFPSIKEEMNVLEMLSHPNIVQYYGVEVHRDKVNIFMEYCEGGSLASLLEHGRIEDEMVTQVYALELLEGLAYLHQSGVVHRDIKPENILLDYNGVIKYVDFGAAKKIAGNGTKFSHLSSEMAYGKEDEEKKKNSDTNIQDMIGTPMYMAPEAISGSKNKGKFGADDVWSLGCVVLQMITGRRPWFNLDNEWAIMYHVAAGHIPQLPATDEVSEHGRRFLKRMLIQNPNKRATALELLVDPWIVEIREIAFGPSEEAETTA